VTDLAQVKIGLQVDSTPLDAAEAKVNAFGAELTSKSKPVTLNTAPAVSQLDKMNALYTQMTRRMGVAPRVLVNTSEATSQVAKFTAQIEAMQKKMATPVKMAGSTGGGTGGPGLGSSMGGLISGALGGVVGGFTAEQILGSSLSKAGFEQRMSAGLDKAFGGSGMYAAMEEMSKKTAYMKDDLMQAAVVLSDVGEVGGLTATQLEKLTQASTGLAATSVRPELMDNVSASATALGKALTGMDRGLKLEGIQTNDAYMSTVALGGAFKGLWLKMTEAQQMQARYQAILDQMKGTLDGASTDQGAYNRSVRESAQAIQEAKEALGMFLIKGVKPLASAVAHVPIPVLAGGLTIAAGAGVVAMFAPVFMAFKASSIGSAIAAASIQEGGAVTAAATLEAGAVTAAATLEAGATAAAATNAGGGAVGALEGVLQPGGTKNVIPLGKGTPFPYTSTKPLVKGVLGKVADAIPGVEGVGATSLGGAGLALAGAVIAGTALGGAMKSGINRAGDATVGKIEGEGYLANQKLLSRLYQQQIATNKSYGVWADDKGTLHQGAPSFMNTKSYQNAKGEWVNPYGEKIGSIPNVGIAERTVAQIAGANTAGQSYADAVRSWANGPATSTTAPVPNPPIEVKVNVINQTGGPIQATPVTNAGSYAPSSQ